MVMKQWLLAGMGVLVGACGSEGPAGPEGPPGEMGEMGTMGDMGTMGTMGTPGLACWDLNANATCDVADEDTDGDGSCDVADCQGADGEVGASGVACWDTNGNAACDVATEDLDMDGSCTAVDCRGAAGPEGPAGAMGAAGAAGPAGPIGPAGPAGPAGAAGPAGPAGAIGPAGPAGPPGSGAGTFTYMIPATSCTATGTATNAESANCSGGGTTRTDGSSTFPCILRGAVTGVGTYVCPVVLPDGAQIDEVRLSGRDNSASGYLEGAIWRTGRTTFGPTYFSGFAGTWQSSGTAFTGAVDLPLFRSTDPPHTVLGDSSYVVGIGAAGDSTYAYGVQVTYTIL